MLQILPNFDRPVYRDVLANAFRAAWKDWRYWPLAFLASLLLTAGSYDVLWKAVLSIHQQGTALLYPQNQLRVDLLFSSPYGLQVVLFVSLLFLAVAALSCMAQGGLVYALGGAKRGKRPTLKAAFLFGGSAFWPLAALNALVFASLWVLRFLVALPLFLALQQTTALTWLLYIVSFLSFLALSFVVSIVHIFALNAMLLQGASVSAALTRGYAVFKQNWMVTLETAALLFCLASALSLAAVGIFFILMIPFLAAVILAGVLHSKILLAVTLGVLLALFLVGLFVLAAFIIQFQYATWTYLYRRLGEGGVLPKLQRWMRALVGSTTVSPR